MNEETKKHHPSYGTLYFGRSTGGKRNLFGSSIKHSNTVKMVVYEAELNRDYHADRIYGNKKILEAEMSLSQFAEAITSMNYNTGVPVTLRYIRGVGTIEDCPFVDKREEFQNELKAHVDNQTENISELIKEVKELFDNKKSINKGDKEEVLTKLHRIETDIKLNTPFMYQVFNEQMDKTVHESKKEIEAFVEHKMMSLGQEMLQSKQEDNLKTLNDKRGDE